MIHKLMIKFDTEGTLTGYTFSSIVSEMAALSDPVREACHQLYRKIQTIYASKLMQDGFPEDIAQSKALLMTAAIEGAMMLCLTEKSTEPLKTISLSLPSILK